MPKLNRYLKKDESQPLDQVIDRNDRKRILQAVNAMEGYMMCSCIALGLLQMVALRYSKKVPQLFFRYLRTPSKSIVSEATVMAYLRRSIFCLFARNPRLTLTQIIREKQDTPEVQDELRVS